MVDGLLVGSMVVQCPVWTCVQQYFVVYVVLATHVCIKLEIIVVVVVVVVVLVVHWVHGQFILIP